MGEGTKDSCNRAVALVQPTRSHQQLSKTIEGASAAIKTEEMKDGTDDTEDSAMQRGSLSLEEEIALKRAIASRDWVLSKERTAAKLRKKQLKQQREMSGRILAATGVSSMDELVAGFLEQEEEKFAHVKLVNDLSVRVRSNACRTRLLVTQHTGLRPAEPDGRIRQVIAAHQ